MQSNYTNRSHEPFPNYFTSAADLAYGIFNKKPSNAFEIWRKKLISILFTFLYLAIWSHCVHRTLSTQQQHIKAASKIVLTTVVEIFINGICSCQY